MKIYFVRHGETEFNLHHVLMGNTGDVGLDVQGMEQAKELAEKIAVMPIRFDIIFASSLGRAQETARIIGDRIGVKVHVRKELEERDYGRLEGDTYEQIQQITGYGFPYIEEHLELDLKKYGVENLNMVKLRLAHFLADLKHNFSGKKILVVAHKGIITALYQFYPQTSHSDISNASVHEFEI